MSSACIAQWLAYQAFLFHKGCDVLWWHKHSGICGQGAALLLWATPNQGHPNGKPPFGKSAPSFDFVV
jgi:hypothetical protein